MSDITFEVWTYPNEGIVLMKDPFTGEWDRYEDTDA
jgi:hypothetical protein